MPISKVFRVCTAPVALLLLSFAHAADTGYETFVPAQSSTVFVPAHYGQVVGLPRVRDTSSLPPREFPALWFFSDTSSNVEIVAVNDESSLAEGESLNPPGESVGHAKATHRDPARPKIKRRLVRLAGIKHPTCVNAKIIEPKGDPELQELQAKIRVLEVKPNFRSEK